MNEIKIERLYQMSYYAVVLNSLKQNWTERNTYNFIGNEKKQHLLFCLTDCSAVYTLKDGSKIIAPKNSIVYVPEGSEYEIGFTDCTRNVEYNSIAINFKLYDENNQPFCFNKNITVYSPKNFLHILRLFCEIADCHMNAIISPKKIEGLFYILLSDMAGYYHLKNAVQRKYNVIAKGINALESNSITNTTIGELAEMCNVSPIYFRKLFKEYSGMTPMEYKLNALISQAKQHLLFSNKSVNEVSEILGFSSPTYFCRIFKKKTGLTPMQYIRKELEE